MSSIDKHGTPNTNEVLEKAAQNGAVLFGSVGGPEWADATPKPECGILRLRHRLDAFAHLRPYVIFAPSLLNASPLETDAVNGTRFIVARENCGEAYFGDEVENRVVVLGSLGLQAACTYPEQMERWMQEEEVQPSSEAPIKPVSSRVACVGEE